MNSLLYISVLPVILLLFYIYSKDKHKEPGKLLFKMFVFGIISFIPIIIFEELLSLVFDVNNSKNLISLFIAVFITIGVVEEFFKWLIVRVIGYNNREFDEVYDAIVYSVCASLGFAVIENLLYIVTKGFSTGLIRAFTAIPVHTCNGVIMGYYLGIAKKLDINSDINYKKYLIFSLLMPIVAHTVYDFLLMSKDITLIFVWFVSYITFVIICLKVIKKVSNSEEYISNNKDIHYCMNCGSFCETNYCSRCGYKNK